MDETGSVTTVRPDDLPALLDRWVEEGLLSRTQAGSILHSESARAHLTTSPATPSRRRSQLAVEAVAYLGGVLTLAAAFLLVQLLWDDLSDAGRLAIPVAASAVLLVAGASIPAGAAANAGLVRLRSALWLLSLGAAGAALGVLGHRLLELSAPDTWLVVGVGTLALGLPLYLRTQAPAQHLGVLLAALFTAGSLGAQVEWGEEPTIIGLCAWVVAVTWFGLAERDLVRPAIVGRYLAAIALVVTATLMAGALGGQVVMLVTLAGLFAWGIRADSVGLLIVASVGTVQAIPSAIQFFFPDDAGVAVPLLLLGVGAALVTMAVTVARRRSRTPQDRDFGAQEARKLRSCAPDRGSWGDGGA